MAGLYVRKIRHLFSINALNHHCYAFFTLYGRRQPFGTHIQSDSAEQEAFIVLNEKPPTALLRNERRSEWKQLLNRLQQPHASGPVHRNILFIDDSNSSLLAITSSHGALEKDVPTSAATKRKYLELTEDTLRLEFQDASDPLYKHLAMAYIEHETETNPSKGKQQTSKAYSKGTGAADGQSKESEDTYPIVGVMNRDYCGAGATVMFDRKKFATVLEKTLIEPPRNDLLYQIPQNTSDSLGDSNP